ncbi:glycosyltransferase [candidate division KSB1 bacterium]|nr:glycosyltransferase [candidate division KSB1 bacterium]
MPDALVIQWSRLGDILHTRPLLAELRRHDWRVTLSCDERYLPVARLLPEVNNFLPVPLAEWSGLARHAGSQPVLLSQICAFATSDEGMCDSAIVLSRSLAAVRFAESAQPRSLLGYRREDSRMVTPDPIAWIEQRVLEQRPAAVHLADAWRRMAGCQDAAAAELPPVGERRSRSPGQRTVAILCDSGDPVRSMPPTWVANLAHDLGSQGNVAIVLLGLAPPAECDVLADAGRNRRGLSDRRGATDLAELIATLGATDVVIGADTGALHLAAELGCRCIGLYHHTAVPHYTAPYRKNMYVGQVIRFDDRLINSVLDLALMDIPPAETTNLSDNGCEWWRTGLDTHGLILERLGAADSYATLRSAERQQFFDNPAPQPAVYPDLDGAAAERLTIVIPECGSVHYTDGLLRSLLRLPAQCVSQIVVVSSGPAARSRLPVTDPRITLLTSNNSLTFAQACNTGAASAVGDWLLFLNNDVELTAGSISHLFAARRRGSITTPTILYPDGTVQNCGLRLTSQAITEICHGEAVPVPQDATVAAVSGIAMLIEGQLYRELGGFDEAYVNGYEDIDLCLRAAQLGANCRCAAGAVVTHCRGSTPGRFQAEAANKLRFDDRWAATLPSASACQRSSRTVRQFDLLFISDEPAVSAGAMTRWILPLAQLDLRPDRDFAWIQANDCDHSTITRLLDNAATVIIFRPLSDARLIDSLVQRRNDPVRRLVVDSDDLMLDRFRQESRRGQRRAEWERAFWKLMNAADVVTASSVPLHLQLAAHGIDSVVLHSAPPVALVEAKSKRLEHRHDLRIGLISGPAHATDVGMLLPALETVLERNPRTMLYYWGARPGDLCYHPQVRMGGPLLSDYAQHLQRLADFDLDLICVPLIDSPANRARTPLKFYECALLGVPGIFSRAQPYSDVVQHGLTGLLADDQRNHWADALEQLIVSEHLRSAIVTRARDKVAAIAKDLWLHNAYNLLLERVRPPRSSSQVEHLETI